MKYRRHELICDNQNYEKDIAGQAGAIEGRTYPTANDACPP